MSIQVALAGNPNCGKTTLFNGLTGATQYVGNWPGVTVEKKEGKYKEDKDIKITDQSDYCISNAINKYKGHMSKNIIDICLL
jgi:Fe2+ transport system protein B